MTEEEMMRRRDALHRGRETAAANRAARAAMPKTAASPAPAPEPEPTKEPPPPVPQPEPEPAPKPEPEPAPAAAEAAERRRRLLADLDAETAALISDDELEQIEREERASALAEQKKQALRDVRSVLRQRARVEHDLVHPDTIRSEAERKRLAEPVRVRISLPGDGAGHRGENGFRVDNRLYQDGKEYTVSRAVYESLLAMHAQCWKSEIQFKTLDQHKPGNSAVEILGRAAPQLEVRNAA